MTATEPETVADLLARVSKRFGVLPAEVLEGEQHKRAAGARHTVSWILYGRGYSLSEIGRELGRDHTSILYGIRNVHKSYASSAQMALYLDELANPPAKPPELDEERLRAYVEGLLEESAGTK